MIRATKESSRTARPKLERRIRRVCRTYCPDGKLTIGEALGVGIRYSGYIPKDPSIPAVVVVSRVDSIHDIYPLTLYPDFDKSYDYVDTLKNELRRQQKSGEFKYW